MEKFELRVLENDVYYIFHENYFSWKFDIAFFLRSQVWGTILSIKEIGNCFRTYLLLSCPELLDTNTKVLLNISSYFYIFVYIHNNVKQEVVKYFHSLSLKVPILLIKLIWLNFWVPYLHKLSLEMFHNYCGIKIELIPLIFTTFTRIMQRPFAGCKDL